MYRHAKSKEKVRTHTHEQSPSFCFCLKFLFWFPSSFFFFLLRVWCVRMSFMCGMHGDVTLCEVKTYKRGSKQTHTPPGTQKPHTKKTHAHTHTYCCCDHGGHTTTLNKKTITPPLSSPLLFSHLVASPVLRWQYTHELGVVVVGIFLGLSWSGEI
jgi:hypothetical protein